MRNTSKICKKTTRRDPTSSTISTRMSKRIASLMSRIHTTRFMLISRRSCTCYRRCRTTSTATQWNSRVNPRIPLSGWKDSSFNSRDTTKAMWLWSSSDADARHFCANIRYFNGHFSFTSLYCHLDRITTNMQICGVYMFHANAQIYHNIRSFGKEESVQKSHLELYFYDDDLSLEHQMSKCREQCA
jgi:hypothetical protein